MLILLQRMIILFLKYDTPCFTTRLIVLASPSINKFIMEQIHRVSVLDMPLYPTLITKMYSSSEFQMLFCYSSFIFFFSLCLLSDTFTMQGYLL